MSKATPAAKARHLQTKQRQLAKLSAEIKAMEEEDPDAMEDEDLESEGEEKEPAAAADDTTEEVEGEGEEEEKTSAEGDEYDADAEDEDEKVEARVAHFQSLPEAKGQQTLAATLAKQGKSKADAKILLSAAAKDARLAARKDHAVPRAGGGSAKPTGSAALSDIAARAGLKRNQRKSA